MRAGEFAVDPDASLVIHRAEMQEHSLGPPLRGQGDAAAIPDIRMKCGIANAAELAFKAIGDRDGLRDFMRAIRPVLLRAQVRIVEIELPRAVQIHPQRTLKLRLRILGTRDGAVEKSGAEEQPNCRAY